MTKFYNEIKFMPSTPKTYEVKYVENKSSGLSPAARSKVINKSGGNYLSERTTIVNPGYGPCTNSYCPHSKEELQQQLRDAENKLRNKKEQIVSNMEELRTKIESHHSMVDHIEWLHEQRETGMGISQAMESVPVFGQIAGGISGALIDAVSTNDLNQARATERERRNAVVNKVDWIITWHRNDSCQIL